MATKISLYGISPVQQCLLHNNRPCFELYMRSAKNPSDRHKEILSLAGKKGIPVKFVDSQVLGRLSNTKLNQGVVLTCGELKRQTLDDFMGLEIPARERCLLVAFDQLEDPQNVGAIIRSAAFLGASGIITLKKNSAPLTPAVSKASAGALEYFPIIEVANLSETLLRLKRDGFSITGATLSPDSIRFSEIPLTDAMVLVVGNEGQGLRRLTEKRCDSLIHIPGKKETESLNVSAAAAILIQYLVNNE
jgi:23S rRNA (guanosine2251-2'-O)-methyltransferase